jgi:hypothetical protein
LRQWARITRCGCVGGGGVICFIVCVGGGQCGLGVCVCVCVCVCACVYARVRVRVFAPVTVQAIFLTS